MYTSTFFRVFPPPQFLLMKHSGLDISDEAIHSLEFNFSPKGFKIEHHATQELPPGLIEGGDIRNEEELVKILREFNIKNKLSYVKVAVPEEKAYLFQTDIPSHETKIIRQNIEFKLEENVPLTVSEALFYFDILPLSITKGNLRASVSVVPRAYIEKFSSILERAGMSAIGYEVVPKSLARAIVPKTSGGTHLIVHMMRHKTGLYVVSDNVVCFTSTVTSGGYGEGHVDDATYISNLSKEINRVHQYWLSHDLSTPIENIHLVGKDATHFEPQLQKVVLDAVVPVQISHVWANAFDINTYVPPISQEDSLEYAVAAGLAMPLIV